MRSRFLKLLIAAVMAIPQFALSAVTVNVNDQAYLIPQEGEKGWGTNVTNWIRAISGNTLQPSGGLFPLSNDLDFGAAKGLKSSYYSGRSLNVSAGGLFRLANTDQIGWRNTNNDADLFLSVLTDKITFKGIDLVDVSTAQTLTNKSIDGATNSVSNLPLTAVETKVLDANKFLQRDATGIVVTNKNVPTGAVVGDADTQTLTNKTLSGLFNTILDVALSSLKSEPLDASKFVTRDATGAVVSTLPMSSKADTTALNTHITDTTANLATKAAQADFTAHTQATTAHGTTSALVGINDTQTLTNKTLTSPFMSEAVLQELASAPATPSAGFKRFYAKADGQLYTKDSLGNEVKVGAGEGGGGEGGINILKNADFELGLTGWTVTNSGAAVLTEPNAYVGKQSVRLNPTSTTTNFGSLSTPIVRALRGQSCEARVYYKGGDAAGWNLEVRNESNTLVTRQFLRPHPTFTAESAYFLCPSDAEIAADPNRANLSLRIVQADAMNTVEPIDIDQAYLGSLSGMFETTSPDVTSAKVAQNGTISDMSVPWLSSCTASASGIQTCNFAAGYFRNIPNCTPQLESNLAGSVTLRVRTTSTTSISIEKFSLTAVNDNGGFQLICQKSGDDAKQSVQVLKVGAEAWKVDASITGSNYPVALSSSYIELTHADGSLKNNPGLGTVGAEIACPGGTPSSGTTCPTNEANGIAFNVPRAGDALACVSFSHRVDLGNCTSCNTISTFQIVETPNDTNAILQEGKSRMSSGHSKGPATGTTAVFDFPHRVCGTFNLSAGKKTLRLMHESSGTGATNVLVLADGAVAQGQRDIHWEVYPLTQGVPQPVIMNTVTTMSDAGERVERVTLSGGCAATPCALESKSAGVASVSFVSTGLTRINFAAGTFSGPPTCAPVGSGRGVNTYLDVASTSSTAQVVTRDSANALGNFPYQAICMGPK